MCISTGKYQPARITENRAEDEAWPGLSRRYENLNHEEHEGHKVFQVRQQKNGNFPWLCDLPDIWLGLMGIIQARKVSLRALCVLRGEVPFVSNRWYGVLYGLFFDPSQFLAGLKNIHHENTKVTNFIKSGIEEVNPHPQ
jgi:hypothetical protein